MGFMCKKPDRKRFISQALIGRNHGEQAFVAGPAASRTALAGRVVTLAVQQKIVEVGNSDPLRPLSQVYLPLLDRLFLPNH